MVASLPLLIGLGVAAGGATLAGGALALRHADRLHLILGLSAGAMVGVALFDLAPEAFGVADGRPAPPSIGLAIGAGFFAYLLLDRLMHAGGEESGRAGHSAAAALTAHSVMDGFAIGLAFQHSTGLGIVIAAAVLAHDLADGLNTVTLGLAGGAGPKAARAWLVADAAAPLGGILASRLVSVQGGAFALLLAVFAGAFLYNGAVSLLPLSQRRHPRPWTTLATLLGAGFILILSRLAG